MIESTNVYVRCVARISEHYKAQVEECEQRMLKAMTGHQQRVEELIAVQSLELECTKTGYYPLDDERIVRVACDGNSNNYNVESIEDIRKLRAAFGEYKLLDDNKTIYDRAKNTVSIPMVFAMELETCRFSLIREIPPEAPCRIVTTTRTVTDMELVCDMPANLTVPE